MKMLSLDSYTFGVSAIRFDTSDDKTFEKWQIKSPYAAAFIFRYGSCTHTIIQGL